MKTTHYAAILLFVVSLACDRAMGPSGTEGWFLQHSFNDGITYYAIDFTDPLNGWAVGYSGTIQHTNDGGDSWSQQSSGVAANLWDVCFVDLKTGWICGAANTILKTVDGGKTWRNLSPGIGDNIITSIKFIYANHGWAVSNYGDILKTVTGGDDWAVTKKFDSGGSRMTVFDENTVYLLRGMLYRTFDGGATWDSLAVPMPRDFMFQSAWFVDKNRGFIPTQNGTGGSIITEFPILSTQDGGLTWQLSDSLQEGGFTSIYFVDDQTGWVAGITSIYKTSDGGITWELESSPEEGDFFAKDMEFVSRTCGWIIDYSGEIYKY